MRRWRLVYSVGVLSVMAASALVVMQRMGRHPVAHAVHTDELSVMAGRCAASVGPEGIGTITIDASLVIDGQTGAIPVPCRITLVAGASLTLDGVTLSAPGLAIDDGGANSASQVRIVDSTLSGIGPAGFSITLSGATDSVVVERSLIDFSHGVGVVVGSDDVPSGGAVDISDTELRSVDPDSKGVIVVVGEQGGRGSFRRVTVSSPPEAQSFFFAGMCSMEEVAGVPARCSA